MFLISISAVMKAQTVTSSNGNTNQIPKYSGATSLIPSAIIEVNGNVGIGTASPTWALDIRGNTSDAVRSNVQNANPQGQALQESTNDLNHISLFGVFGSQQGSYAGINADESFIYGGGTQAVDIVSDGGFIKLIAGTTRGAATEKMRVAANGNIGIGTTTPAQLLDVNGNINISGTGAGIYFPGNATPQTVPWTGSLYGQDYADSVDVSGDRASYEPGDVMVIDTKSSRHFVKSTQPYSTLAAGVYSTKPGVVGRRNADKAREFAEVPLAMVGIVPTKVSAENGPIQAGDLLVTSSTPGCAMKGTDRTQLTGAVLGKALATLSSGTDVIDVLVSLQ